MKTLMPEQRQTTVDSIRDAPNFPKPGVLFKDITALSQSLEDQ